MTIEKDERGYWKKYNVRKLCPFCGGKARIDVFEEAECYEPSMYYRGEELSCLGCGVSFREYCKDDYDREEKLAARKNLLKKWKKRLK